MIFPVVCPLPEAVQVSVVDDSPLVWYSHQYHATIELGDRSFNVTGADKSANLRNFAYVTWTDRTLLCWYDSEQGPVVLATGLDFDAAVARCTFPGAAGRSHDECLVHDRLQCTAQCEAAIS